LPLTWWCSSWSVSAGVFFFDPFCRGIVSCFFGWNTVGANVGGSGKSEVIPKHRSSVQESRKSQRKRRGDKESPKVCTRLKSCEPLYTCQRPPFIGRRREFLHSENTLKSREYS
jgi:hypothetical protein